MVSFKRFGNGLFREKRPLEQKVREKKDFESLRGASNFVTKTRHNFIAKIFYIMLKNYKIMIRSKTSALIFFFGPLFIIFLVSLGFNTSTLYGLNIAAYSESYSPLSDTLISNLTESQFNILKVGSEKDCIDDVKFNDFQACIIFPKDMILDNSATDNNILIYVDESRINLANQITDKIASKVGVQADQLSSGIVSQILGSLDNINKESAQQKSQASALLNNNGQSGTQLSSISDSLSGIDLAYTPISLATAYDALEDVRDQCNMSSTEVSGVKAGLDDAVLKYKALASKLDEAKNRVSSIKTNTDTLRDAVNSDSTTINGLTSSVDAVQSSISSLKITNLESIVTPLKTTIKPLTLKRSYFIFTFPTLLTLLIMFVAILMSATSVIKEKKSNAYFRNFITPTNDWLFLIGQYLTDISIIFAQIAIILLVAALTVSGLTPTAYLLAGAVLLIVGTIFVFIGISIGYLFSTEESATLAAASASILFLLFSNSILPIEALSGFLRRIVSYNPFVIGESVLKRLILFESDLSAIYSSMYVLLAFIVGTFLLATIARIINKRLGK